MVIISNLYAHTKVLPILDMNAGTVQCKCGVHYTARETAQHIVCSRSLPCSYCIPLSSTEWDLWQDQEAKTRACGSTRISEESSSPATEGLGSLNVKSDSTESTGNSKSVSSGEDILLASHSGGDARITNLETGLSSLQTSLTNLSPLVSVSLHLRPLYP